MFGSRCSRGRCLAAVVPGASVRLTGHSAASIPQSISATSNGCLRPQAAKLNLGVVRGELGELKVALRKMASVLEAPASAAAEGSTVIVAEEGAGAAASAEGEAAFRSFLLGFYADASADVAEAEAALQEAEKKFAQVGGSS